MWRAQIGIFCVGHGTPSSINPLFLARENGPFMYIYIIPWESRYGQRIDLRVSVNFAVTDRTLPPPGAEVAVIQPFKT